MNELLRKADVLVYASRKYIGHELKMTGDLDYARDVIDVIHGYQDLLRRMSVILEACASYVDGVSNLGDLEDSILAEAILVEARESIPEANDGEA